MPVTGNFPAQPGRLLYCITGILQFNLCHNQPFIVSIKLIHLEYSSWGLRNNVAGFVYDAAVAEAKEGFGVGDGNFNLPFRAGDIIGRWSLYGEDAFVIQDADADGVAVVTGDVALLYAVGGNSLGLESVT